MLNDPMTPTSLETFFALNPVFTIEEADRFLSARQHGGAANRATRQALLGYYVKQGRLRHVRRGLYTVTRPSFDTGVGVGRDPSAENDASADTFLIASRLTSDAVLAYHTALDLHGLAHSLREERIVLSEQKIVRPLLFAGVRYQAVQPPSALSQADRMTLGVETQDRQGLTVRVTGIERTLVDILDRPALAGGWEEAWRAWESVDIALDFRFLLRYVQLLGRATTAAKLGYALETNQEQLAVPATILEELHALAPRQPHPAQRGLRSGTRLIGAWNLLVPAADHSEPHGSEPYSGKPHSNEWHKGEL